jgi:cysteinyl-tRNA synthetase
MDALSLYDTRTRSRVPFTPADPANVRMYVCGPTVYDLAHIGNARPIIVFDVLFRLLRHRYGADHVTYVRNVTDVDDKINARAAERGIPIAELTETTLADFHADVAALHCLQPTREPRATEHIAAMRAMIDRLVDKGHAYVAEDHVLFQVASADDYGCLSHRSVDEMLAGARVDVAPYKRDPMDFVLWKPSRPGEPAWPSPAGIAAPGRPGWHIECSAMAAHYLGETFDIHGGGIDLAFPHHENERAQTCAAFDVPQMASVWMHNGFLQVEGRKMAKSEGNFVTIRDALATASGDALRLAMLMTQYRQPIDWTARRVEEARSLLSNWAEAGGDPDREGTPDPAFEAALADDLNTPAAVARLSELARERDPALAPSAALLGIDLARVRAEAEAAAEARRQRLSVDVDALIAERLEAKARKDFARADAIRDRLAGEGIVLKDGRDEEGRPTTRWEFA